MIKTIVQSIQTKCQDGHYPQAFKQQIVTQSQSFKRIILYIKDFINLNQLYIPQRLNYNDLINYKYELRLQHQVSLNGQHGQQNAQLNNHVYDDQANLAFFNSYAAYDANHHNHNIQSQGVNQQHVQVINANQHQQSHHSHLNNVPVQQHHHHVIAQPIKQSPLSSQMGPITFTQANRHYSHQSSSPIKSNQTVSTLNSHYQFSNNVDNLYAPSYQKSQHQAPLVGSSFNYSFGGIINDDHSKPSHHNDYKIQHNDYKLQHNDYKTYQIYQPSVSPTKYQHSYGKSNNSLAHKDNYTTNYSSKLNFNNLSGAKGATFNIGNIDSTKTYQNPTSLGYSSSHLDTSINGISNKYAYQSPVTVSNYGIQHYTGSKPGHSSFSPSKVSTYSFDGRNDVHSKFGHGYSGTGYSNILTKYQTQTHSHPLSNIKVQKHHTDIVHTAVSPSIRTHTHEQVVLSSPHQQHLVRDYHSPHAHSAVILTSNSHKRQGSHGVNSHVSQHNLISRRQSQSVKGNALDALAKMIQRQSNNVSESVLKEN